MSWQHSLSLFLEIFKQFESLIEQRVSNFVFYVFGKFPDHVTKTLKAFLLKQTLTWKVILDTQISRKDFHGKYKLQRISKYPKRKR